MNAHTQRLSIIWGLPAAIIVAAIGGMLANVSQWLGFDSRWGTVWFTLTIVAALLSRWHAARQALGLFVTAAFAGRAITAMFYATDAGFVRPVAALCVWLAIWLFAIQAVGRINYVRATDRVITGG